ncbi:catechol-2,3-dioxygenase [Paenibacillus mucilaginosus]|uniref:VOC family protein n=1 Tax=Paenibacillus mucilaginosus TaxID=61624 RepID=UPI003D1D964E
MSEQLTEIIVNEVVQIYLPSTNIKRTVEWYKNVFGFQVIWEQESAANLKLKHGPFLFIKKTSKKQPVQFETDEEVSPVVSFKTSDLNRLHEKLKSEKYQVGEINQHGEGINGSYKDFNITDPDGNLIEVSSYPDLNLEQFRGY